MTQNPEAPQDLYQHLLDTLETKIDAVEQGEFVNFTELESLTERLCGMITQLPSEQANAYRDKLQVVIERLNVFSDKLTEQQEIIRSEVVTLNQRQNAQNAYLKANAYQSNPNQTKKTE